MSLDVYLKMPGVIVSGGDKIFIRRDGAMQEISRQEWDSLHPEIDPYTFTGGDSDCVYDANITHNLNTMADKAGLYECLWRPDEHGITKASQLIEPLRNGLIQLITNRKELLQYNPSNGWGNYELLVEFTMRYLAACEDYPEAKVSVWR